MHPKKELLWGYGANGKASSLSSYDPLNEELLAVARKQALHATLS